MGRALYECICTECGKPFRSVSMRKVCTPCYIASPAFVTRHNSIYRRSNLCKRCGRKLTGKHERDAGLCCVCGDIKEG